MKVLSESRYDPRVAAVRVSGYPQRADSQGDLTPAVLRVAEQLGWSDEDRGPLGNVIANSARVLIKPNFVLHRNQGGWGTDSLVTHSSLVRAVTEAALRARPAEVRVGDAPLQSCDFGELLRREGLDRWSDELMSRNSRFKGIRDFRRTTCTMQNGVRMANEDLQPEDRFVLFDLGRDSLLEPISHIRGAFRVTRYDPRLMANTHAPGRHQYLVAREVLEADVIVNLPKLKTHKKAGVTCALKNLIGINGNKEFLPHHRIGGDGNGGDCYPGSNPVKKAIEYSLDRQNMAVSFGAAKLWNELAVNLDRVARLTGDRFGTEGSWSGNDTIWRTCLDLNRILLYGKLDGTLDQYPQRQAIHIVDAVIAGQGDGPVSPKPLPLGLIFAGQNPAAVDWVGALLLGYEPERIPLVREAFRAFAFPISSFTSAEVFLSGFLGSGLVDEVSGDWPWRASISYPAGWANAARPAPTPSLSERREA